MSTTQKDDEFEQARSVREVIDIIADARDSEQLEAAGWKLIGLARKAEGRGDLPDRAEEVLGDE